ncbi:MAG: chromosomal replication initiator protein DnaA [Flavobacteriales bacterium]|nr:chromosomal replication initiator protein DnaA [Flavobacteriales bacterium]MCX7768692.1 chromosomal replication initiator protein DnaA [Flavobacteriales bacterium]MDW8410109.1 chromosomal replication initiator protein DnaA [Flavobacteriales bacterium]
MTKTHTEVWEKILKFLSDNLSAQTYRTWFEPIVPVKLENDVLTIQVPSQFYCEWIEEHYIPLLSTALRKEIGPNARLEYNIVMDKRKGGPPFTLTVPPTDKAALHNPDMKVPVGIATGPKGTTVYGIPGLAKVKVESNLSPSYTFDNFVEGECNRLARAAGYAISKNPGGTSFNPLFIYGPTGMGKTHLANAIGVEIKKNHPDLTVLYVRAEKFINQFVEAVRKDSLKDFLIFYQNLDVLIVDDVHELAGKEKTQDVFFNIFNQLHMEGKQIVLTSDTAPSDLKGMENRLLSRFKWGLSADLSMPDLETRIAILRKKLYYDGIELPDEIIEHIAYSITSSIRELEGAVITLTAHLVLTKKNITLELAKNLIERFVQNTAREISIEYIQKIVCDYYGITVEQMKSKTRRREVVQTRQIIMYFSKLYTKHSLASIGQLCGNKDHATVLHACKTVSNLRDTDKNFRSQLEELEKKINIHRL